MTPCTGHLERLGHQGMWTFQTLTHFILQHQTTTLSTVTIGLIRKGFRHWETVKFTVADTSFPTFNSQSKVQILSLPMQQIPSVVSLEVTAHFSFLRKFLQLFFQGKTMLYGKKKNSSARNSTAQVLFLETTIRSQYAEVL